MPLIILREAFGISTRKRIEFATKEDSTRSFENPLCIDLIVPGDQASHLDALFQQALNAHLPQKGELQKRATPCFVLKPIEGRHLSIKESTSPGNDLFASDLTFEGKGVTVKTFIAYLENVLQFPIYDATGLTKLYDISFSRDNIEPVQSTMESLAKLGLELVKDTKEIDFLVISGR